MKEATLLNFFGLQEQPFGVTPDPRYLYLSSAHREALESLQYGIESNCGFLALIASPGMGKTTILYHLLSKLNERFRTAFLFQNRCESQDFMRLLLAELGVKTHTQDFVRLHTLFYEYILQEARNGRRFLILIDEAQDLAPSVLDAIRVLSNFETFRSKLLQIILAGQPELANVLTRQSLSQLRQRIVVVSGLSPLTAEETRALINHRLQVAGYASESLFSPDAVDLIAKISQGIPRQITNYCFHALWLAYLAEKHVVDNAIVRKVAHRLDMSQFVPDIEPQGGYSLVDKTESDGSPVRTLHDSAAGMTEPSIGNDDSSGHGFSQEEAALYIHNLVRRIHNRLQEQSISRD